MFKQILFAVVLFAALAGVAFAEDLSGRWIFHARSTMWVQDDYTQEIYEQEINKKFLLSCKKDWSEPGYDFYVCTVKEINPKGRPSPYCEYAFADMGIQYDGDQVIGTLYVDSGCQAFSLPFRRYQPVFPLTAKGITWEFCSGFGFGRGQFTLMRAE